MQNEKGHISIHTENIFPIIKKFLYSDHEIFLRELVSNAVDASQKVKKLYQLGESVGEIDNLIVDVKVNKDDKTIIISDNGIGMTADDVKKYINQVAYSGATEFVEKFKDAKDAQDIIGKFGLGFYSAFMVADKVEIQSLSYQKDAQPVKWTSDGNTEYSIEDGIRTTRGTDVILYINAENENFLEEHKISEILKKYAQFLPITVRFGTKTEHVEDGEDEDGKTKYKEVEVDNIINDKHPIWTKSPSDLKDEDYLDFYQTLYPFSEQPLFWIHLNVDYPFNLTGILYFPKVKNDIEIQKNKIKLYSRQVFITDEVKEIIPEYLMLMHGVIDSPDIPLNVSRSYLQSDGNVKKISQYISKKVSDKLSELYKNDRKDFESKWDDIGLFIKYGMLTDDKFYDRIKDVCLLKNTDNEYFTFSEYHEKIKVNQTDKHGTVNYLYAHQPELQYAYIQAAKDKSYDVINFNQPLDTHFVSLLEQKMEKVRFKRIDSDTISKIIEKDESYENVLSEEQSSQLKEKFTHVIAKENMQVEVVGLSPEDAPVTITMDEWMRRMKDMNQFGGGMAGIYGQLPDNYKVTVNGNHPIMKKILESGDAVQSDHVAKHIFDLARLSQNLLKGQEMDAFVKRSLEYFK